MSEWQDIEAAPKDGTPVILYRPDWYAYSFGGKENENQKEIDLGRIIAFWNTDDADGWWEPLHYVTIIVEPTHWMPLPEPPK